MTSAEISQFMHALKLQIQNVKRFLDESGYEFDNPDEALPGVSPDNEKVLLRISKEVGDIPKALLEFYRVIGSVNFCGHHKNWSGCKYPNPLVIYPPEAALSELDEYLEDRAEYEVSYGGFRISIAPDYYHKADVSGGMWYGVAVPAESDNPIVLEEHHNKRFVEYLALNLSFGGFLGLENQTDKSTWPLDKLRAAANQV